MLFVSIYFSTTWFAFLINFVIIQCIFQFLPPFIAQLATSVGKNASSIHDLGLYYNFGNEAIGQMKAFYI